MVDPQWGRAGRSSRRRRARELAKEIQETWQEKPRLRDRLLAFIEQPLFTLPIGILGGLVGLFLYSPVLTVCGVCVILAFHRAGVVSGLPFWKVQLLSYVVLTGITVGVLFWVHVLLQKELAKANISLSGLIVSTFAEKYPSLITPPTKQDVPSPLPGKATEPRAQNEQQQQRARLDVEEVKIRVDTRGIRWWAVCADIKGYNRSVTPTIQSPLVQASVMLSPLLLSAKDEEAFFNDPSGWVGAYLGLNKIVDSQAPFSFEKCERVFGTGPQSFSTENALKNGEKIVYVFTKAIYADKYGKAPELRTCGAFKYDKQTDQFIDNGRCYLTLP